MAKPTRQYGVHQALAKPRSQVLHIYYRMYRQDITLRHCVDVLVDAVVSGIGRIHHPDSEIADFCNQAINNAEDEASCSWQDMLAAAFKPLLWAGFSVSEPLFTLDDNRLEFKGLETYNPLHIEFVVDTFGKLSEGKETPEGYRTSGIYQNAPKGNKAQRRLPLWKVIYLCNEISFGNYYGVSLFESIYRWYALKEQVVQLMVDALSSLGTPFLYIVMPKLSTGETFVDPSTGLERVKNTFDDLEEQFRSVATGEQNGLLIPQPPDGTSKVQVGQLSTQPNVGRVFLDTLQYIDEEMVRGILPYFLIGNELRTNHTAERRMEIFYSGIEKMRYRLMQPIIKKLVYPLIQWNFDRESAAIMPTFSRVYTDRPEDRVATMQVISGLTDRGYLNPLDPSDFSMAREMVRANSRELTPEDVAYIKQIVERRTKAGRPVGSPKPQIKPRPKVERKPKGEIDG